jgi:hypothetical protein
MRIFRGQPLNRNRTVFIEDQIPNDQDSSGMKTDQQFHEVCLSWEFSTASCFNQVLGASRVLREDTVQ